MRDPSIELRPGHPAHSGRPEPGTVAICFVTAALEAVRARHMDPARVSAEHYGKLWRLIALTLDDEFFGWLRGFDLFCHPIRTPIPL